MIWDGEATIRQGGSGRIRRGDVYQRVRGAPVAAADVTEPHRSDAADGPSVDRLGRPLRDLRISVTDRCNFRCPYCMPGEVFGKDW